MRKNCNMITLNSTWICYLWVYEAKTQPYYCCISNKNAVLRIVSLIFFQCGQLKLVSKMVLFLLKSSFRSRNIQIFVFPPCPLFLLVSYCLTAWSKINLKVYDVVSCLNKNLITHFVWYLEKKKSYDIETLAIDTVLNKEHFYGKIMQKMCTKS